MNRTDWLLLAAAITGGTIIVMGVFLYAVVRQTAGFLVRVPRKVRRGK